MLGAFIIGSGAFAVYSFGYALKELGIIKGRTNESKIDETKLLNAFKTLADEFKNKEYKSEDTNKSNIIDANYREL